MTWQAIRYILSLYHVSYTIGCLIIKYPWISTLSLSFDFQLWTLHLLLRIVDQNKDQRTVNGRKGGKAGKSLRYIGHNQYHNLEYPEKKETTGLLNRVSKKTTINDYRQMVSTVKMNPKTTSRDGIITLHCSRWLTEQYRIHTTSCKPHINSKIQKARLQFTKKYRDGSQCFWN